MASLQNITNLRTVPRREVQENSYGLESYPEINIHGDVYNSLVAGCWSKASESMRNVMISVNEGALKRIIRTFFESGFNEALNEARNPQIASTHPIIAVLAKYTFESLTLVQQIRAKMFPYMREHGVLSIASYSETRDWNDSFLRCIAWHPNCFKIAVAGSDDVIRIYTDEPAVMPLLKSVDQKYITSMAWRPYTCAELAVGCEKGLCLWTMDGNMHITRSSSQAVFLKHPNHCPITSVQWNADGTLLATASIGDTDILIWNVDQFQQTSLKRVGPPYSFLKWSPDGANLFSATVGNVFRVWSCDNNWEPERWTINSGCVKSACWSPCSNFLLFVTTAEPILYRLQFFEEHLFTSAAQPKQALPIADLTKIKIDDKEVGGQPQQLAWDPDGTYLAITFKDSNCIAIFSTAVQKFNLTISPSYFLTGASTVFPSYICFQSKNHKNSLTVLTIGWSSGRIQYFPLANM